MREEVATYYMKDQRNTKSGLRSQSATAAKQDSHLDADSEPHHSRPWNPLIAQAFYAAES